MRARRQPSGEAASAQRMKQAVGHQLGPYPCVVCFYSDCFARRVVAHDAMSRFCVSNANAALMLGARLRWQEMPTVRWRN